MDALEDVRGKIVFTFGIKDQAEKEVSASDGWGRIHVVTLFHDAFKYFMITIHRRLPVRRFLPREEPCTTAFAKSTRS